MPLDVNILVGGEAGQGVQTIGLVLGKALARAGLSVFADQDYESRIRGGHNFFRIRVDPGLNKAQNEDLDIILALNRASVELHRSELKGSGLIIGDSQILKMEDGSDKFIDVPLEKLALTASEDKIMSNTVALGVILGLLEFPFEILAGSLQWHFAKASERVRQNNLKAARAGYDYIRQHPPQTHLPAYEAGTLKNHLFLNGNEAIALGAMAAGCKFVAAYPMTPITSILEFLAEKGPQYGIGVIQPEDEIAAINMVIGASYAGTRSMTVTSGSGFALMVEGLGLAGITETPAVVVLGQRPGPAVGLPTRTEQGELLFAIQSGTGEFPRIILAPANAEEAFYLTARAFNLAEQFQVPVIIITDTHLANSYTTLPKFDLEAVKIERGEWLKSVPAGGYRRYQLTETGLSARLVPGSEKALVSADADEHDENGHLTELGAIRTAQNAKRLKKMELIKKQLTPPHFEQKVNSKITLIGWGSTCGAIRECAQNLFQQGIPVNVLHFSEIWPFPSEFTTAALKATPLNVVVELNAGGQMAHLIHSETGLVVSTRINKWDGRPISARYILEELHKEGVIR
jgi:2-oxoglutarate/2-oxoacid ferredoxin oxidoreductase subunit alpha